jgi:hypothetical protein
MLTETQRDGDFFIAQVCAVRRKVFGKIALVVACAPLDDTLEQPFADTFFRTAAHAANLVQQR